MTDTLSRGAANQAGAIINPNAAAEAQDFLPLKGIDHVEFWVGNAKQAAHYYRALWGFTPVAYAGLETGVRDRSSFVMVQNDIRFVFTAPDLGPTARSRSTSRSTATACRTSRSPSTTSTSAWRETTTRGAGSALEPTEIEGKKGTLRRSAIHTYGEVIHSFVDRSDYHGTFAPGYHKVSQAGGCGDRAEPARGRPLRRQRRRSVT